MTDRNDDPAFPMPVGEGMFFNGISVRDYFAAAALTGIMSRDLDPHDCTPDEIAADARKYADAMLAARGKP
jgi:hypothetical protein